MRLLARLAASVAVAVATAIAVAIGAALVELYLAGHGDGSITRELIDWPAAGVHLSAADVLLLVASTAAAIVTWHLTAVDPP